MRRFLFYILAVLSLPICCEAKQFTLKGTVLDDHRQPLQYVNILIKELAKGVTTDEKGQFSYTFDVDSRDSITVSYSFIGYLEVEKKYPTSKAITEVKVILVEQSELLDQYEMNAYRKQETSIERIDVSKLKTMPNASGGIESLIATQAGVSSNNELSSQYSVRGGNYDENSVYVNSIEIYRPLLIRSGEQEGLSFVNPDMVESLSFSSGGFGVEYGDKMSSVLDIRYKEPSDFEGSVSLSLLGASAYMGQRIGKFTQMHGVRYKTSSYMLGSLQTEAEYNPNFLDYQTYMTYSFSDKWKLSLLGNISRNDYEFEPQSRETSFGTTSETKGVKIYFDGGEEDLFLTFFGSLGLSFDPNKHTHFELLTSDFHTAENVSYDISGSYWLGALDENGSVVIDEATGTGSYHEHARDRLNATVANVSLLGTHKLNFNQLKWGATYQREKIDDYINEWELRDSAGYSMPMRRDALMLYNNLSSDMNLETNRLSAYLQNTFSKNLEKGKISLSGGLRLSYWSFNDEWLLSPRLAFAWFPRKYPNWGLRISGGRYYQSLFYKEIRKEVTDSEGNSTLELNKEIQSPRSYQVVIGSDYYFKVKSHPFKFSTEAYGKYIDRIIPYTVDNTQITYKGENCADGYAMGIDFKLFGEFVPGTDSWISLSLMNTKENIYGVDTGYVARPTDQLYNVSLFFQDYVPGFDRLKVNLKLIWAQGLPFGYPGSDKYKSAFRANPYRRVDLGAIYQFRHGVDQFMDRRFFSKMKTISLCLDFFNLLNIKNENSYYWIQDASGMQFAVPNYLTGFRVNFKLQVDF